MAAPQTNYDPGVYVVTKAILDAQPGDHVTVCPDDQPVGMLHRDLGSLDLKAMLRLVP